MFVFGVGYINRTRLISFSLSLHWMLFIFIIKIENLNNLKNKFQNIKWFLI